MSNFYSFVSSIKDKSTQAMATLSSDLKEFSSIMQEDVAEVAKNVRSTVHEKSETMRQRVEQRQQEQEQEQEGEEEEDHGDEGEDEDKDQEEKPKEEAEEEKEQASESDAKTEEEAESEDKNEAEEAEEDEEDEEDEAQTGGLFGLKMPSVPLGPLVARRGSGSFFSFAAQSLEEVGSKILQSADDILGTLAGDASTEEGDLEDEVAKAREYRLLALQEDPATYLEAPSDAEAFAKWKESVNADELKDIQEQVLANYPVVAAKMQELVSETLTEEEFWARYIFMASQLAAQAQRGADLLEHALQDDEEEIGWDADSPRNGDGGEKASARPGTAESASESEGWTELDEQQKEGKSDATSKPLNEDEEDVDWGDDDENDNAEGTSEKPDPQASTAAATAAATDKKGGDWGEWD